MRTFNYPNNDFQSLEKGLLERLQNLEKLQHKLEFLTELNPSASSQLKQVEQKVVVDEAFYSAKIEGINVSYDRLKLIVAQPTKFPNIEDSEKQALGYAMFLKALNQRLDAFDVSTTSLLAMFQVIFSINIADTRGLYRKHNTQKALMDGKIQEVEVSPVEAFESPLYIGSSISALKESIASTNLQNAENIAKFCVDFLCIRPFDVGNGRIARLFCQLCMYKAGLTIGRYASLSRIFESQASDYYNSLNLCSKDWNKSKNSYQPFVDFYISAVENAYEQLFGIFNSNYNMCDNSKKRKAINPEKVSKPQRIKRYIATLDGRFKKADIVYNFPDISVSTIENTLYNLVQDGTVEKHGKNKGTYYKHVKQNK